MVRRLQVGDARCVVSAVGLRRRRVVVRRELIIRREPPGGALQRAVGGWRERLCRRGGVWLQRRFGGLLRRREVGWRLPEAADLGGQLFEASENPLRHPRRHGACARQAGAMCAG